MHFSPEKPFNQLPDLPPKAEFETPRVLKATTRASRALAELKGRTHSIPNPTILLNTLALQEAKLSSEIENIFTTNDELYRGLAANGKGADLSPHAKEVLHYRDALWRGMNVIRDRPFLSSNLAIEIVNIIKENKAGVRNLPGTKLQNPNTKEVIYTPPEGEDLLRRKAGKPRAIFQRLTHPSSILSFVSASPTINSKRFIPSSMGTDALVEF